MNTIFSIPERSTIKEPSFLIVGYSGYEDLALHPITDGKVGQQLPFSKKTVKSIFNVLYKKEDEKEDYRFKSLIPSTLLFVNPNRNHPTFVWYSDAKTRFIEYSDESLSGNYPTPKTLFKYHKGKLQVFALKKGTINGDSELYQAPYYNVYTNGGVCMGNVNYSIEEFTYIEDTIQFLEQAFFQSVFTHSSSNNLLTLPFSEFLTKYKDTKQRFQDTLLVATESTLNTILQ